MKKHSAMKEILFLMTAMIIAFQGYGQADPMSIKKENPKANPQVEIQKETRSNLDQIFPCFGSSYRSDRKYFRASAKGASRYRSMSEQIAIVDARANLAREIFEFSKPLIDEPSLSNVSDKNMSDKNETSQDGNRNIFRENINITLTGLADICNTQIKTSDSVFLTYVALQIGAKDVLFALHSIFSKDEKYRVNYNEAKFRKVFEEELLKKPIGDSSFNGVVQDYSKPFTIEISTYERHQAKNDQNQNHREVKMTIPEYNEAIERNPKDAQLYNNRGNAKLGINDYSGAIDDQTKCIDLNPKYAKAYYDRGMAKNKLSNGSGVSGAIADFSLAVEINPKYSEALRALALNYARTKSFKKAIECFNSLIINNMSENADYYNLGKCYYSIQDFKNAELNLSAYYTLEPESIPGLLWTARTKSNQDKKDSRGYNMTGLSEQSYKNVIRKTQTDTVKYMKERFESFDYLAFYHYSLFSRDQKIRIEAEKALDYYEKMCNTNPNDVRVEKVKPIIETLRTKIKK